MKKYKVNLEWSGYSRGIATRIVEVPDGENVEAYIENFWRNGQEVDRSTVRNDLESEVLSFEEMT